MHSTLNLEPIWTRPPPPSRAQACPIPGFASHPSVVLSCSIRVSPLAPRMPMRHAFLTWKVGCAFKWPTPALHTALIRGSLITFVIVSKASRPARSACAFLFRCASSFFRYQSTPSGGGSHLRPTPTAIVSLIIRWRQIAISVARLARRAQCGRFRTIGCVGA